MLPLVEIPDIVGHYAPHFEGVFSEAALEQFKRYVSGLILSENKTVDGINRIFVKEVRNQSSLNRLLSESPFCVSKLNGARLDLLWSLEGTSIKQKGVLSLDDTLLTHYGKGFEKIAKLFDPVTRSYVYAHNLVNLHYSDDKTDYPIDFQLWEPAEADALEEGLKKAGIKLRESKYVLKETDAKAWRTYLLRVWSYHQKKPQVQEVYLSKLLIGQRLLSRFFQAHPHHRRGLPVTFDAWYTKPEFCKFLDQTLRVGYVGTLTGDVELVLKDGKKRVDAFAKQLKTEHLEAIAKGQKGVFRKVTFSYKGEKETCYSYCNTHRVKGFGKLRLVITYHESDLSDAPTYFISNRMKWRAPTIIRIRRHRWPVEVYHEEGKADGLSKYQVRSFEAIQKHIALVAVTYSILRAAQHDPALLRRLHQTVRTNLGGSAGRLRRHTQAQALWALACAIQAGLAQGETLKKVMQPLLKAVSY